MRFSIIALVTPLALAATAMAGFNCKCQDATGQNNFATQQCCSHQDGWGSLTLYHDDQVHQCTNGSGALDSGAFVICCQGENVGGAFCWA